MTYGPNTDPRGEDLLRLAAGDDVALLAHFRERACAGEPIPWVTGFLVFRGRRFRMDRRAYITDPELSYLVDLVIERGDAFERASCRPPQILEFGTGAGTLLISVALERPHWKCSGLDVDASALELAESNADDHGLKLDWITSDFFSAWNHPRPIPDLVFGDPPWGTPDDLYDAERDGDYYSRMPAASAFPPDGKRTGIHDQLLLAWARLQWPSQLLLNYGILPPAEIARSATPLSSWSLIQPRAGLSVLCT
jgi:hypothetical protein